MDSCCLSLFWLVLLYLFFVLACIFVSGGLVGGVCVSLYVSVCLCVCGRFHLNLALTSLSFRFFPLRYAVEGAFCHNVLSRLSVCILGQCVFSMLLMCGRSVWYSMTNGRFFGVVLDLVVCGPPTMSHYSKSPTPGVSTDCEFGGSLRNDFQRAKLFTGR